MDSPGRLGFALYTRGYFLKTRAVTVDLCEKVPGGVALLQVRGLCCAGFASGHSPFKCRGFPSPWPLSPATYCIACCLLGCAFPFTYVVLGITPRPSCNDRKVPTTKLRHSPYLANTLFLCIQVPLQFFGPLHAPLMLFLSA